MASRNHRALDWRRWERIRRIVLLRDRYRCRCCGAAARLEVDHVKPMERGGATYDPANLQALCRSCHIEKTRRERQRPIPGQLAWREAIRQLL